VPRAGVARGRARAASTPGRLGNSTMEAVDELAALWKNGFLIWQWHKQQG